MAVLVRGMKKDDFDGVRAIFRQLHRVHSDGRPDWFKTTDEPLTEEVFDSWFQPGKLALVAELDGEIVGFCSGFPNIREENPVQHRIETYYIEDFATLESVRRKGVGRALFEGAKERIAAMGFHRIGITVWAFNRGAREFYEAMGMTQRTVNLELDM